MTLFRQITCSLAPLAISLLAAGCGKEEIRAYQVPKEKPPVERAQAGEPAAPPAHVRWEQLPAGWQEKPASGLRVASFLIKGGEGQEADLGVIPLPRLAGKELEFVNMWREQIALEPTTTNRMAELRQPLTIAGEPGQLFDMVSEQPLIEAKFKQRVIAAMMTREDTTWFFKLSGPDALVAGEKGKLIAFLEKLELHSESVAANPPAGLEVTAPAPNAPAATPGAGLPTWSVPEGWKAGKPGPSLLASYDLPGGEAKVTVSSLGGLGGGLLANVNRWRGQLGLPAIAEGQLGEVTRPIEVGMTKASLVELTNGNRGMLTLMVPREGQTWFYKSLGPVEIVEREREAFLQFARSAQY